MNSLDASSALQKLCQARLRLSDPLRLHCLFHLRAMKVRRGRSLPAGEAAKARAHSFADAAASSSRPARASSSVRHFAACFSITELFIMNSACGATTVELRSPFDVDGSGRSKAWNISYIELRTTGM